MASYNGYTSRNAWKVSLWINSTESDYLLARDYVKIMTTEKAVEALSEIWAGRTAPDGAVFNKTAIRQAVRGI